MHVMLVHTRWSCRLLLKPRPSSYTACASQARVTNYLTVPNPINMCQPHLGRIERIHTKLHLQTDVMHVVKCLLGTGIRLTNWVILAHLLLKV